MTGDVFYDDGQVVIVCADVRTVDLDAASVAAVVTSPPYNVGLDYDRGNDAVPWPEYWRLAGDAAEGDGPGAGAGWPGVGEHRGRPSPSTAAPGSGSAGKRRVMLAHGWADALAGAGLGLVDQVAWCSSAGRGHRVGVLVVARGPQPAGRLGVDPGRQRRGLGAHPARRAWTSGATGWGPGRRCARRCGRCGPPTGVATRPRSRSSWPAAASGCRRGRARWCSTRSPGRGRRCWRPASSGAGRSGWSAPSATANSPSARLAQSSFDFEGAA